MAAAPPVTALPFRAHGFPSPRPGLLFSSPSGSCRGLLAGKLFDLDGLLAGYPVELAQGERLGLSIEELDRRHGTELGNALDGACALVAAFDDRLLLVRDAIGTGFSSALEPPSLALAGAVVVTTPQRVEKRSASYHGPR